MFSKTCEYAIRAALYIGAKTQIGERVGLIEVAKKIESPEAFTSKILQRLVREEIIFSIKGPGGGFYIDETSMAEIKISQIVECFDGDVLNKCSLGLDNCSDEMPCPFHTRYKPVKARLKKVFEETSIKDLIKGFINEETFLKL